MAVPGGGEDLMLIAITMVRDEADVIGTTVRHLLAHDVDHVIVADNLSTDATRGILDELARDTGQVTVLDDLEPGYYQSAKMSRLACQAWERGATWVLPFDADEVWYSPTHDTIAQALKDCPLAIVNAFGFDHIPQPGDQPGIAGMVHRRAHPQRLPKVAFRADPAAVIQMGNHFVTRGGPEGVGPLEYRHFQWRSPEQMARKVRQGKAAYEASDLHQTHGAHWRQLGALDDVGIASEWQALLDSTDLVHDPAPIRA